MFYRSRYFIVSQLSFSTDTDIYLTGYCRFRVTETTDTVCVSDIIDTDFVSEKELDNENSLAPFRSFPTVFIPKCEVWPCGGTSATPTHLQVMGW